MNAELRDMAAKQATEQDFMDALGRFYDRVQLEATANNDRAHKAASEQRYAEAEHYARRTQGLYDALRILRVEFASRSHMANFQEFGFARKPDS